MKTNKPKTLLFIAGVASAGAISAAQTIGASIRNSRCDDAEGPLEKCDFVMGDVPERYVDIVDFHEHHEEFNDALAAEKAESEEPETDTDSDPEE